MAKKTKNKDSINSILIKMLMVNVGTVSGVIEKEGRNIFGQANLLSIDEINDYSLEFLELLVMLLQAGDGVDRRGPEFSALRQFFTGFSQQIQIRGGSLDEFVRYVQFLQGVFINSLNNDDDLDVDESRKVLLLLGSIFNEIILDVFHTYLEEKERTINAQQEELRETSTPITEIWDGVLTLPIIGTLDSTRTMVVMENLLNQIEQHRSRVVVLDITGVVTIDSQVSHHLIKMVHATGLMGAQAILTGIRPEIARALADLNIDFSGVVTRATLADGLKEAFKLLHIEVVSSSRSN